MPWLRRSRWGEWCSILPTIVAASLFNIPRELSTYQLCTKRSVNYQTMRGMLPFCFPIRAGNCRGYNLRDKKGWLLGIYWKRMYWKWLPETPLHENWRFFCGGFHECTGNFRKLWSLLIDDPILFFQLCILRSQFFQFLVLTSASCMVTEAYSINTHQQPFTHHHNLS